MPGFTKSRNYIHPKNDQSRNLGRLEIRRPGFRNFKSTEVPECRQIMTDAAQILFTFIFAFSVLTENSNTLSRRV